MKYNFAMFAEGKYTVLNTVYLDHSEWDEVALTVFCTFSVMFPQHYH